jgi:threonine dehydratase
MMDNLLREILASRVYEVVKETSLDPAPRLSRRLDNHVLV